MSDEPREPSLDDRTSVSVVIATHHRPELLRVALDAVLGQTHRSPIECIVVFDRSEPDESLMHLADADWPGPREVHVVSNERTPGLAGARNTGVLAAAGEWVAFCDDDDEWFPDKLQRQFAALDERPAEVCVTGIRIAYGDGEHDRIPSEDEMTVRELARRRVMAAHPSTVLVRASALRDVIGLVDEGIPGSHGEDYDWILRAAGAGRITVADAPLVRVRWGQSFFAQNWQVIIDAIDHLLEKHPELSEDPGGLARLRGQQAFAEAALGHRRTALGSARETLRLSWREPRAYLAGAVALHLVSAPRLMDMAHRRGRGI